MPNILLPADPPGAHTCKATKSEPRLDGSMNTYKSITSGLPRLPVGDDDSLLDVPEHFEVFPEARVGRVVREPPHEDLGERGVLLGRVHHAWMWKPKWFSVQKEKGFFFFLVLPWLR